MDNSSKLILIVDDQPDNLNTIKEYLANNENYEFIQAINGEMGCKLAEKRIPDLIIMDWEMPVMSGYDAVLLLKSQEITSDIPVIMSTGRSNPADLEMALIAGASDYIRKPIEKLELVARVRNCLRISDYIKVIKVKNEKLDDKNHEIESMMNIVAHDLRSPLSKIKGFVELVKLTGELNPEQTDCLNKIKDTIEQGNTLIRDILDIHYFESEEVPQKTLINIQEFITLWELTFIQYLQKKEQKLHITFPEHEIIINSNKELITRILDNLLSNAIKFSEKRKNIYLDINETTSKDFILISIKDEGPGISKADQKKMFKKFQTLTARPTDGEDSNGLGLAIIKTLIEKLKGSISLKSDIGLGTEFTVKLPSI